MSEKPEPIEVPHGRLAPDTLRSLIEEFVTRDGTDYGSAERSLDSKIDQVHSQLERGEVRIVFDPETGTANIVLAP